MANQNDVTHFSFDRDEVDTLVAALVCLRGAVSAGQGPITDPDTGLVLHIGIANSGRLLKALRRHAASNRQPRSYLAELGAE
jgi:hypothetical protein